MLQQPPDLILSEVLARVAFRRIVQDYRAHTAAYEQPTLGMWRLAVTLENAGFRALAMWVSAAAFEITASGCTLADWRDRVVVRARQHNAYRRMGSPWRRAPNPRVTNRGVMGRSSIVRLPWGAQKARWSDDPIR